MKPAARKIAAALALAAALGCGIGTSAVAGAPSPSGGPERPVTHVWGEGQGVLCQATTADLDGGCSLNRLH